MALVPICRLSNRLEWPAKTSKSASVDGAGRPTKSEAIPESSPFDLMIATAARLLRQSSSALI